MMNKPILVTGSAGHLGEAMMRRLKTQGLAARGLDLKASAWTSLEGSIGDAALVRKAMRGCGAVLHTATLHKPHVATHAKHDFINTNIEGTLNLLQAAVQEGVSAFVFTSTTSAFGDALVPPPGEPAAWITEDVPAKPKNIYGVTKTCAEDLCQLFHRNHGLPAIVLRTSRFFPEADDNKAMRSGFADENLKCLEFLYRRADIGDIVDAHMLALEKAPAMGFERFIISATSPFKPHDLAALRQSPQSVIEAYVPGSTELFTKLGWRMPQSLDRVYVNAKARERLGWQPRFDFAHVLARKRQGLGWQSDAALAVGSKGYHDRIFEDGPFPV